MSIICFFIIFLSCLCLANGKIQNLQKINIDDQEIFQDDNKSSQVNEEQQKLFTVSKSGKIKKKLTEQDNIRCVHNEKQEQIMSQILAQEEKEALEFKNNVKDNKRKLTSFQSPYDSGATVENMRITYTLDTITESIDSQDLDFIEKQMDAAVAFYEKRLQVVPLSTNIISQAAHCQDVIIPSSDQSTGIPDSDYHIYVTAKHEPDEGYIAYATYFQRESFTSGGQGRPILGNVHFNTYYISDYTDADFAQLMETTLHEIAHAFGFSPSLFYFFRDTNGNFYNGSGSYGDTTNIVKEGVYFRSLETYQIITPQVKAWAAEHFGCDLLNLEESDSNYSDYFAGLQLENQGSFGSIGAHWERTILFDEVMTASRLGTSKTFSGATLALFKDMGWYLVNTDYSDKIQWGYKKGCDFVRYACEATSETFSEFCTQEGNTQCTGGRVGKGICKKSNLQDYFMDSNCGLVNPYSNLLCIDSGDSQYDSNYRSSGQTYAYIYENDNQYDSRCFESTFGGGSTKCYRYECRLEDEELDIYFQNSDGTYNSDIATCIYKGQILKNKAGLNGELACPDPVTFCKQKRNFCKNYCSSKGYCSDGICVCKQGFGGLDCSVDISGCASDEIVDSDNNCISKSVCESDSSKYVNSFNKLCSDCHSSCASCSGGSSDYCLSCNSGYLLLKNENADNGECHKECPKGYYSDGTYCLECDNSCATCESPGSSSDCTSCSDSAYWLQIADETSEPFTGNCVSSCSDYKDTDNKQCFTNGCPWSRQANGSECEKCSSGTYMSQTSGNCEIADNCENGTYADEEQQACLECDDECENCFGSDQYSCLSCNSGSYLFGSYCLSSSSQCPSGSYGDGITNKCEKCDSKCLKCSDSTSTNCSSCKIGYFLNGSECVEAENCPSTTFADKINRTCTGCDSSCLTCFKEGNIHCSSCQIGEFLVQQNGSTCESVCPDGTYADVNSVCQRCHYSCKTCSAETSSDCDICQDNYYRESQNNTCVYKCPEGFYGKQGSSEKECQQCSNDCLTCSGPDEDNCTGCKDKKFLYKGNCVNSCPQGVGFDQDTMECFGKINCFLQSSVLLMAYFIVVTLVL
ncbi:Insulin-like growth factor binding protein, N-terminal [Pseudocohnilembus persalinus]|uniref:Insulin-like growth factor binding protein, N-terminal n=1 Tax=Pseudocohnilembus persalinus TaxID=266149 RepID=A0A0V0QU17_PSEPJ|nr:Insulin-like growth factor binding protein, N-terminal [Pseudocohnilembus persalinus]|eukprot:KRX05397.1 Insulin-like growth factor binding protein, N-terminal [Pseudocohnilembus persalinus]